MGIAHGYQFDSCSNRFLQALAGTDTQLSKVHQLVVGASVIVGFIRDTSAVCIPVSLNLIDCVLSCGTYSDIAEAMR
jgi:hypothetical protein